MLTALALPALLVCLAASVSADIYKWVDQNGRVQYGDTPPAEAKAKAKKLELKPNTISAPPPPAVVEAKPAVVAPKPAESTPAEAAKPQDATAPDAPDSSSQPPA
ncbi:DUF4124 domain-containing protein [Chitinimonas arctica]|uniref:DUF4124 domain-containing protein n=2 Tax=Chitinimonas arctica TaxID=2594795 RepID=A0A516SC83_9NEIS|nr:DUF4124 domain-containing protein [Chitinimonas arctica]